LRNKLTDKLYSYYDMSHIKNILINKKDKWQIPQDFIQNRKNLSYGSGHLLN
jgi:hypothetical protein